MFDYECFKLQKIDFDSERGAPKFIFPDKDHLQVVADPWGPK